MTQTRKIPYARQSLCDEDIRAVLEVLKSDRLTQGPRVEAFEAALADYCGARYAVAVCNGTAALHLALRAADIQPGDVVVTTPLSFVATSNAVLYCGAEPAFADVQPDTFNLDPRRVEEVVRSRPRVKALLPVHFAGLPADLEALHRIAHAHDLWLIDDACHALGGVWRDRHGQEHRIGDGVFTDLTVFSFHPVKHITTAEGGAVVTNRRDLYEKMRDLRGHGIVRERSRLDPKPSDGDWYYEMQDLGYNYRLSDLHAALGLRQLRRCDAWMVRRQQLVSRYDRAFSGLQGLSHQAHPDAGRPAYHLYVVQTERRKELYEFLHSRGVQVQVHYLPIHRQPYYRQRFGYRAGDFPVAEGYYRRALSLPLYPALSDEEQDYVIACVKEFHEREIRG